MKQITILEEGDEVKEGDAYWNQWSGWCLINVKGLSKESRIYRIKEGKQMLLRRYETNPA